MVSGLGSRSAFEGQKPSYANGIFFAGGYPGTDIIGPTAYFTVTKISYGISLDYSESESRANKTVYFKARTFDNFMLTLAFSNWQDYQNAADWFASFCNQVTDPNNSRIQPMGILVPDPFGFSGVGIPQAGITYGDQVGELVYHLNISFVGTSDPTDNGVTGGDSGVSRFKPGPQDALTPPPDISLNSSITSLATYYPFTTVVGAIAGPNVAAADDTLYNNPTPPAVQNFPHHPKW